MYRPHTFNAFACGCYVLTFSWFGLNAMIVTNLFEPTFKFAPIPIVKDNKLRSLVTCQPGVIKQILGGNLDVADLFVT
jgi:hypothetical protein